MNSLEITISARDADRVAAFWAVALGYRELYRRGPYVVLGPVDGAGPRVLVQSVGEHAGSSVHLDLRVDDPDATVERLLALGASVARPVDDEGRRWTVMTDPEGTEFCVCSARPAG